MGFTIRRLARAAALAGVALALLASTARAGLDDSSLSPAGALNRVASDTLPGGGSRILHTIQSPDGSSTTKPLPGTEDSVWDLYPVISVEPKDTGRAVAVWTRRDASGDRIVLSIFDGRNWSAISLIPDLAGKADYDPRAFWGTSGIIHIMWRADSASGSQYWWAQYDSLGRPLSGPSPAPATVSETVVDSGGSTSTSSTIGSSDVLFSFTRPATGGGGMILFGGRDEPNPIGCVIVFAAPKGGGSSDNTRALKAGGRVAFTFRFNSKTYYSLRYPEKGSWTAYRILTLSSEITEDRARSLVRDMIERIPPTATE
jgi:hypothetical protein